MLINGDVRTCPVCREEIKKAARRCPYCQTWQGWWMRLCSGPFLGFLLACACFSAVCWVYWGRQNNQKEDFQQFIDQIQVYDLSMDYAAANRRGTRIVTVGKIKNNSPLKWAGVNVEVQYYDAQGALVDSCANTLSNLVLIPNLEQTFKISCTAEKPAEEYASQQIFLRDAHVAVSGT